MTASHVFRVDPAGARVVRLSKPDDLMAGSFSLTRAGDRMAFVAGSPTSMNEVFMSELKIFSPRKLTDLTEQTQGLTLGTREVISWKSQDVAVIEGILIEPV